MISVQFLQANGEVGRISGREIQVTTEVTYHQRGDGKIVTYRPRVNLVNEEGIVRPDLPNITANEINATMQEAFIHAGKLQSADVDLGPIQQAKVKAPDLVT